MHVCIYQHIVYVDERNYQWRASLLVSVWPEQVNKPHLLNAIPTAGPADAAIGLDPISA